MGNVNWSMFMMLRTYFFYMTLIYLANCFDIRCAFATEDPNIDRSNIEVIAMTINESINEAMQKTGDNIAQELFKKKMKRIKIIGIVIAALIIIGILMSAALNTKWLIRKER